MGRVVISLDAELAWGFHDLDDVPGQRIQNARSGWRAALSLFDRYEIPATWAVVGHLCLGSCDGTHADHPAPADWFDRDPGGSAADADRWFAPDLVEAIRRAAVDHEIGCHSFSHVLFDAETTDEALADAELDAALDAAARLPDSPKSFVFPRNRVAHRDRLAEHGFTSYRGRKPREAGEDSVLRAPRKAVRSVRGRAPPVVDPAVDEWGLVNVPASLYLFEFETRLGGLLPEHPTVRRARAGVDAAAESSGVFHLWLHPNNLIGDPQRERLRAVLQYIDSRRREGAVSVETMQSIAETETEGVQ